MSEMRRNNKTSWSLLISSTLTIFVAGVIIGKKIEAKSTQIRNEVATTVTWAKRFVAMGAALAGGIFFAMKLNGTAAGGGGG